MSKIKYKAMVNDEQISFDTNEKCETCSKKQDCDRVGYPNDDC